MPESEFGESFTGYYRSGIKAVNKILSEKKGQIQGAFYREGIGDIDVVWGKVTNAKKHEGFGIAHIKDKHPDFDFNLLPKIIKNGKIEKLPDKNDKKEKQNINIQYKNYTLGIRNGYVSGGEKVSNNRWIVTSYEKN